MMSSSQVLVDYLFPLLQLLFFGYHLICNEQSIGISTILFKYILLSVSDPNVFYLWFRHLFISQVWSLDYDILNYWGTVQRVLEGLLTFSVFWVYFILFFFFAWHRSVVCALFASVSALFILVYPFGFI
jgi:hypothetical protein